MRLSFRWNLPSQCSLVETVSAAESSIDLGPRMGVATLVIDSIAVACAGSKIQVILVVAPLASYIPPAALAAGLAVVAANMAEQHEFIAILRRSFLLATARMGARYR